MHRNERKYMKIDEDHRNEKKNIEITVGITYRGASQKIDRPVNFPTNDNTSLTDPDNKALVKIQQWSFILGFTFPYADKVISNNGIN